MVIAATYLLFIAGSVVICRILQKNKKYYYKTNHFISVSQMSYRMKRNGAGLASICILSTMVLVTLSSTICLYAGEEDMLRTRFPRNIVIDTYTTDEDFTSLTHGAAEAALEKYGEGPRDLLHYRYLDISGGFEGDRVILDPGRKKELENSADPDIRQLFISTIADYNSVTGRNEVLADGEAVLYATKTAYNYDTITLDEYGTFRIKAKAEDFENNGVDATQIIPSVFIFVKDEAVVKELYELQLNIYGANSSYMHDYYGFDLPCTEEKQTEIYNEIENSIVNLKKERSDDWPGVSVDCAAKDKADFYALYGGLFFLGIVLGSVFICAAVLIMYYKQISEGYEDKARFGILRKVGMSRTEIRKCINSQVLTVFFLPLIAAGIHTAFAFPIISRLLTLFGLTDSRLFAEVSLCCFGAFSLLYAAAYVLTSRSYYRIVSTDKE